MTTLKVDFDRVTVPHWFESRLLFVARVQRLRVVRVSMRRTVHGWHVVVTVAQRIALSRVILLQALLGSDWKRELYNSRRALRRDLSPYWRARVNVLYTRHYRNVDL